MTNHLTFYVWENRSGDIGIHDNWDSVFQNVDWDYFNSPEDLADIGILKEYSLEGKNRLEVMDDDLLTSNRLVYKLKGEDDYYDIESIYELEEVCLADIDKLYIKCPLFISEADQAEEKMQEVTIQDIIELLAEPTNLPDK